MTVHSIYTIRDHAGCVRYVGMTTHALKLRAQNHASAKTELGRFIRSEYEAGRTVTIHCEEKLYRSRDWRFDKNEFGETCLAHSVEDAYIAGYAKLVGSKLFNRAGNPYWVRRRPRVEVNS